MKKLRAIWELMRLEHGVMLALAIFIGSLIALQSHGDLSFDTFPWVQFVLTFFTALFLEASTFALNDYYDLEIDKKNKRIDRPLARGDLQPQTALYLFYLFFPMGIICSYFVNFTCFIIALITALFAIIYDVFLKKIKLLSNFYIAYVMAIPFVFGAAAIENTQLGIDPAVVMVAMIAFLAGSGREIMKDVMDFKGDTTSGVKSFPRYIGIRASNAIAAIFYILAVFLSVFPFLLVQFGVYHMNYVYLFFIGATDIVFLMTSFQLLVNTHIVMARYRKITLLGLFLGLLAFFLGAFIG
ncbi:MAG: UbiA family prenyltransferase [Thermoplasmatota archaeon]